MSKGKSLRFVFCWLGGVALVGFLLMIGTRGPFVSLAITVPLMLLTSRLAGRSRLSKWLGALLVVVLPLIYIAGNVSSGGSARILLFLGGDSGDVARSTLYALATEQVLTSPLGLGWSGFDKLSGTHTLLLTYPHNIFLEIFSEGGWLAGVAFILYAAGSLLRLRVVSSLTSFGLAFYGLAIYWLLAAQFSSDINGNRMTWSALAFGFGIVAVRSARDSSTRSAVVPEVRLGGSQ